MSLAPAPGLAVVIAVITVVAGTMLKSSRRWPRLSVLNDFLKLPHQEVRELNAQIGDVSLPVADFRHLPTRCKTVKVAGQIGG